MNILESFPQIQNPTAILLQKHTTCPPSLKQLRAGK